MGSETPFFLSSLNLSLELDPSPWASLLLWVSCVVVGVLGYRGAYKVLVVLVHVP